MTQRSRLDDPIDHVVPQSRNRHAQRSICLAAPLDADLNSRCLKIASLEHMPPLHKGDLNLGGLTKLSEQQSLT